MTDTQAWNYAVGMIKVDGLEPTPEFKELYKRKESESPLFTGFEIREFMIGKRRMR